MGAWGHGSFENDSALDWVGDLCDGEPSLVGDALRAVADADADEYLEADGCSAALAAAELVAAGSGHGDERLHEEALAWLQEHRSSPVLADVALARRALDCVFRASELRELWDENGADTEWHADVRELLRRLGG